MLDAPTLCTAVAPLLPLPGLRHTEEVHALPWVDGLRLFHNEGDTKGIAVTTDAASIFITGAICTAIAESGMQLEWGMREDERGDTTLYRVAVSKWEWTSNEKQSWRQRTKYGVGKDAIFVLALIAAFKQAIEATEGKP